MHHSPFDQLNISSMASSTADAAAGASSTTPSSSTHMVTSSTTPIKWCKGGWVPTSTKIIPCFPYRMNTPNRFYICLLVEMRLYQRENELRLYLEARGEDDLRHPKESTIEFFPHSGSAAAKSAPITGMFLADKSVGGHHKGYLSFRADQFAMPGKYQFTYGSTDHLSSSSSNSNDYASVLLFEVPGNGTLMKAFQAGSSGIICRSLASSSPFDGDCLSVEMTRFAPYITDQSVFLRFFGTTYHRSAPVGLQPQPQQASFTTTARIYYEAPAVKPLPPGLGQADDVTSTESVLRKLTYADDFEEISHQTCKICLDALASSNDVPVHFKNCGQSCGSFHLACIRRAMVNNTCKCPVCRTNVLLGGQGGMWHYLFGNMPSGEMLVTSNPSNSCAGYESSGMIIITYAFRPGIQKIYHPHPGLAINATRRMAYLPDNEPGRQLLMRLKAAFRCGLTFSVGTSLTTGQPNSITWSVHHKTSPRGGSHGFPDDSYISRCNDELDALGLQSWEECEKFIGRSKKAMSYTGRLVLGEKKQLLYHLIHSQHCPCEGQRQCTVVDRCAEFKLLLKHLEPCTNTTDCSFNGCLEAKDVLNHFAERPNRCLHGGAHRHYTPTAILLPNVSCGVCGEISSALKGAKMVGDNFWELKQTELISYARLWNNPTKDPGANKPAAYLESVRSVFDGSDQPLTPILEAINSPEFATFVESSGIDAPAVEINPHLCGSDMLQQFIEEGKRCVAASIDTHSDGNISLSASAEEAVFNVRVVFHGTSDSNISSILRHGLDPTLRKGQAYGQGEYFAGSPAMSLTYCRGGLKMLVFAVITTVTDLRGGVLNGGDIIVAKKRERQLPIATLSFEGWDQSALQVSASFHATVAQLWKKVGETEKLAKEAKAKERVIRLLIENEYMAASDIYNKACDEDGKPPKSWAEEVAAYVRDHIRDDECVDIHFPNLPPRPIKAEDISMLNSEKCEADVRDAKQKYENMRKKLGSAK